MTSFKIHDENDIIQTNITTIQNNITEIKGDIPLVVQQIWLTQPPVVARRVTWENTEHQARAVVLGARTPPFDPRPTHLSVQTSDLGTTEDPIALGLYSAETPDRVTTVTEMMPKSVRIKVEVGKLGGNTLNLENDVKPLEAATSMKALNSSMALFEELHPLQGVKLRLKDQVAVFLGDEGTNTELVKLPYVQPSSLGGTIEKFLGYGFQAVRFVTGIAYIDYSYVEAGVKLIQTVSDLIQPDLVPSLELPFEGETKYPVSKWEGNEASIVKITTELIDYVVDADDPSTPSDITPIPTYVNNPPIPYTNTINSSLLQQGLSIRIFGPWVDGVVVSGSGWQIRMSTVRTDRVYARLFPATHIYTSLPRTTTLGTPGILTGVTVKGDTQPTASSTDYAQYRIDFSLDFSELVLYQATNKIALDPNVYNAVYMNDKLYAVYNGSDWMVLDNVFNPTVPLV